METNDLDRVAILAAPKGRSYCSLVSSLPASTCEVCVIVPVKDEAQTLEATLTALNYQVGLQGYPLDPALYEIILLANNCSDRSAAIARNFCDRHPHLALHVIEIELPPAEACIGRVRKMLMDEAFHRLNQLGKRRGIIASTDGDTQVTSTWIAATLYEMDQGVDAVGGRIITDAASRAALDPYARACHLREVGYRYLVTELESYLDPDPFDPYPRHFQHFGASFAITAECYEQVGGLPVVRTNEDVALYRALRRVNAKFRHSLLVQTRTSARASGRASLGLANQLKKWTEMGRQRQAFMVESAAAVETRFRIQAQLRELWPLRFDENLRLQTQLVRLADWLGLSASWLQERFFNCNALGLLFEQIEVQQRATGCWQSRFPLVPIQDAIAELRLRLAQLRQPIQQAQTFTAKPDLQKLRLQQIAVETAIARWTH